MKLEARNLTCGYGKALVVHDVTLTLDEGIVAILGPNGAGKSTLLKMLAGQLPVAGGELLLDGKSYAGRSASELAREGVVLMPQTGAVFPDISVHDNLRLGALHHPGGEAAIGDSMARFPVLEERASQSAGSLSGGERQLLAICCALLMRPKVLLLDEPTSGLSPMIARETAEVVGEAVSEGLTVAWVVEQMPELALERARAAYFIEAGQVTYDGPAEALLEQNRLQELMLQHG
jgi:branched-chain amino acid transport system ATP-binding protein